MTQYNLVRNGYFSGSGDYTFTTSNLNTLQDGTLSGTGVTISGINTLTLNLSQRIKVDNIRLYTNDLTKSSNIYFSYRNSASDSYTLTPTYVSDYYYTTIPSPSAPMYIQVTISGVSMTLYEFYVDNYDYIVAFGEDGQLYEDTIDNSPIGEEGVAQAIPIYNNDTSSMPVNAYTCVEPTGAESDDYIELASSYDGTYYKVSDGALLRTNKTSNDVYKWADGSLSNTSIHSTNDNVYVTTTLITEVDYGSIPLSNRTYSWSVGQNCWDYDPVNRVIYAIGAETTVSLKLYKRYIDSGGWIYMGQINPGVTGFTYFATMCYLNGYVYVSCNLAGTFGRYDVNGAQDNWQTLSSVGWSPAPHYVGMCSDKNRYIYAIHGYYTDDNNRQFRRYDTTTSGWSAMNNGYTNNAWNSSAVARRACLAYDYERGYIYADVGNHHAGNYIQSYSVSGNSWNTTWFDVDNYTNAGSDYNYFQTHSYYNNILVLGHALTTGRLYYYNLSTGSITYITKNTEFYMLSDVASCIPEFPNPYILATDIPTNISGTYNFPLGIGIWMSNNADDRGDFRLMAVDNVKWGTYTSPIFRLDDKYQSSYFTIKNTGNVSYDSNVSNGTIRVRSSDTEPIPLIETYVSYSYYTGGGNYALRLGRWIPYTNSYSVLIPQANSYGDAVGLSYGDEGTTLGVSVNPVTGTIIICATQAGGDAGILVHVNRDMTWIISTTFTAMYRFNKFFEFDSLSHVWGYGDYNATGCRTLYRIRTNDMATIVSYSESQQDFISDMSIDYSTGGCWYVNKLDNTLVHMSATGFKLAIVEMIDPLCLCKTTDNGCWVYDDGDIMVYRYDNNGALVSTFDPPYMTSFGIKGIEEMSSDHADGFWFRYSNLLYHTDSFGHIDVGPVTLSNPARIGGVRNGCFVHSTVNNYMYFVNMLGQIQYSRSMPTYAPALFGQFYYGYDECLNYKTQSLPLSYDPIWGGSSGWTDVQKEGYFLPKNKYHQVSTKLWGSAVLNGIYMAPAIKIEDIQIHQSKNLYVRTDIPNGASITDYSANLRTWWGGGR